MRWKAETGPQSAGTEWGASAGARGPAASPPSSRPALPTHNRNAMGRLFADQAPRLRAVALRYTRDDETAADVLQNAFEKILRNGHQFRGGSKVSTWMYRVVANEALMWLRAERRRAARFATSADGEIDAASDPAPGPAAEAERRDDLGRLRGAIARLGPEEREVVERCALEEQSYVAWGRKRGLHPAAAKSRAFRARQHLRELLT